MQPSNCGDLGIKLGDWSPKLAPIGRDGREQFGPMFIECKNSIAEYNCEQAFGTRYQFVFPLPAGKQLNSIKNFGESDCGGV